MKHSDVKKKEFPQIMDQSKLQITQGISLNLWLFLISYPSGQLATKEFGLDWNSCAL